MRGMSAGRGRGGAPERRKGGAGPSQPVAFESDRRRLRGNVTRVQLIDAAIALVAEGDPALTTQRVADRAGVTRRTFYHHFADLDLLLLDAAKLQASQHRALAVAVPARGPVELRIRATCRRRRELFETVAPLYRAALDRTSGRPGFDLFLAELRSRLRMQLAETFGPELAGPGGTSAVTLDALELATGWSTWHTLRVHARHSPAVAERITVYAVDRILR